jgi:hypothetical protein
MNSKEQIFREVESTPEPLLEEVLKEGDVVVVPFPFSDLTQL